ncbi:hypothetical protein KFE25_001402 [Diacronema lutheri]|uniref:Uncharacterized protein n=1 Tax=Diacronema lutheri TaxID=2081491 RepID=A0A8J6C6A5_DIALT|nr:hypothetical protein KFE25_001402 [Diacronema lutheri]
MVSDTPLEGERVSRGCSAAWARRSRAQRRCALACAAACCALVVLAAWLAVVVANYAELARCVHIDVVRVNATSLCSETVYAYVELRTQSPSVFALRFGETRVALGASRAGRPAEPAARVVVPPFALVPGGADLALNVSVSIVGPDALGLFLNSSANGEPGVELRVAVRGSARTRALLGVELAVPFDRTIVLQSAAEPAAPHRGPQPDPAAAQRERDAAEARRLARCGSAQALSAPVRVANTSHEFKVLWASSERLHVAGFFDVFVASPAHVVVLPPLSAELCTRDARSGRLTSVAQLSTRAGSFVQRADAGASDGVVDVLMVAGGRNESALWEATSRILDHRFPPFFVRGSTDDELRSDASPLERPAGFNGATSACPLQRTLQGVSVKLSDGLIDSTHPHAAALVEFVACSWQQLHREGLRGLAPWHFGPACARALTPSGVDSIVPGIAGHISAVAPDAAPWLRLLGAAPPHAGPGPPAAAVGAHAGAPSTRGRARPGASAHGSGGGGSGGGGAAAAPRRAAAPIDLARSASPSAYAEVSFGRR